MEQKPFWNHIIISWQSIFFYFNLTQSKISKCWIRRGIKIPIKISKDLGSIVSFRLRLIFLTYIVSKLAYCLIFLPLAFTMMLFRIRYVHNFCHFVATKNLNFCCSTACHMLQLHVHCKYKVQLKPNGFLLR